MLEKLLESLDKEVYSAEMLEDIQNQFNEAVLAKSEELSEKFIAEALETKTAEIEAKAEEFISEKLAEMTESFDAKEKELEEKSKTELAEKLAEINENLNLFLDKVIDEFVVESKEKLNESLKSAKADMIIEAYDAMIAAGSLDVAKIVEAKDSSAVERKLSESVEKYDALMLEHLELKKEKEQLIKTGIIMEMKEGLSLVESKKFEKLAEMVPFSQDEKFMERLTVIKESVSGVSEKEIITESTKEIEVKVDKKPSTADFSHLV